MAAYLQYHDNYSGKKPPVMGDQTNDPKYSIRDV